jgi:hypothetical protein
MGGFKFSGRRGGFAARVRRWVAGISVASLVLGVLVGVAAVGFQSIAGPAAAAHADPPADAPTSIALTTDESTFAAGSSATLTATTDQDVSLTSSTISIIDETTDVWLSTCTTGTTCTATTTFNSGGPHSYIAMVNSLSSNEVTVAREAWTVGLTSSEASYAAGDEVTFTATANQNVGDTGGRYVLYIFDTTTGDELDSCSSGTTCTYADSSMPSHGAGDDFVAQVSEGPWVYGYTSTYDVQANSDVVTESPETWAVTLTPSETTISAGDDVTLAATANQDLSGAGGYYYLTIMDSTTGDELASCDSSTTCTYESTSLYYAGGSHTYVAEVQHSAWVYGVYTPVEVAGTSDDLTLDQTPWSLTLTTSESTFGANTSATLTATANQSMSAIGGHEIYIFDATTVTMAALFGPTRAI